MSYEGRRIAKAQLKNIANMSPERAFDKYFQSVDYTQDLKRLKRQADIKKFEQQRKEREQRRASRSKGGGSAGGDDPTFPIFNMMKRPDLPEGKKAGGKVKKSKKVRGSGIAKKGVRPVKMR